VTASARADLPPRALADLVVEAASDKKAEDILVLNVAEVTTIADLFVICSARGERQAQAIADGIVEKAKAAGQQPFGVDPHRPERRGRARLRPGRARPLPAGASLGRRTGGASHRLSPVSGAGNRRSCRSSPAAAG